MSNELQKCIISYCPLFQYDSDDEYVASDDELNEQARERNDNAKRARLLRDEVEECDEDEAGVDDPDEILPVAISHEPLNIDGLVSTEEEVAAVGRADHTIKNRIEKEMSEIVGQLISDLQFAVSISVSSTFFKNMFSMQLGLYDGNK